MLGRSAPDTSALLTDLPAVEGEAEALSHDVLELTSQLDANGSLAWAVPDGRWQILRFGCTLNQSCHVSTCSEGWQGYAIDPFDAQTFRAYWQEVVEPLIADAGPLAGGALKYLHTDSWEVEVANWTPTLREEFRRRRGYDLLPFLPAMAGRMVDSREVTNRFLHDFRKTMGDLALDNHYRWFSEWAHAHGLSIHPESGGPHAVPVDSLRCLGNNDAPMSEFWARSWRHRVADQDRFFVKQPASAAHTYGRPFVLAEGFTTIGPHWQETLWDNLKPSFNRAACEGLNRLVWHAFTCSPDEMGRPGQEYFAGTHFNPNATWWNKSGPFLAYINRCQLLLQRGRFVADALYYYGDHVPNFAQLKASDPARILPGYDYDVATEEVLLTRLSVRDGRMVLPDGVSYRVLVLPNHRAISLPVLRKVRELVAAGGTVIGPKPGWATGLQGYPASDAEVAQIATELWGDGRADASVVRSVGAGRVIRGKTAREVLLRDGVQPDFEYAEVSFTPASQSDAQTAPCLDYIHRRIGTIGNLAADARQQGTAQATSPDAVSSETDIYFVCNTTGLTLSAKVTFRVAGKAPELWDPLTGQIRNLPVYQREADRTSVPLTFAPFGSWFVVFRNIAAEPGALKAKPNFPVFSTLGEVGGPWTVQFDPAWGGPASVEFSALLDWTQHADEAIRFYSGTAVYTRRFAPLPLPGGKRIYLNLGDVRQVAEVRLNGRNLGVLWSMPFRVEVTDALRPGENLLEIEVVNFWANRVIGDQALPIDRRRTRTNIRKLTSATPLAPSGLLGPVVLEWTEE